MAINWKSPHILILEQVYLKLLVEIIHRISHNFLNKMLQLKHSIYHQVHSNIDLKHKFSLKRVWLKYAKRDNGSMKCSSCEKELDEHNIVTAYYCLEKLKLLSEA